LLLFQTFRLTSDSITVFLQILRRSYCSERFDLRMAWLYFFKLWEDLIVLNVSTYAWHDCISSNCEKILLFWTFRLTHGMIVFLQILRRSFCSCSERFDLRIAWLYFCKFWENLIVLVLNVSTYAWHDCISTNSEKIVLFWTFRFVTDF
jgi:uncharacterized protein involved in tolerance to divalent cations